MRASTVERIRKLLRLAQSSNPHEAASARAAAETLMKRWGVTEGDLDEDAIEVADEACDDYREFLAGLAASMAGCKVVRKKNQLGFRGRPVACRRALSFYRRSMDYYAVAIRGMANMVAPWLHRSAEIVWCFWWWDGFAAATYGRKEEMPPPETSSAPASEPSTSPSSGSVRTERADADPPTAMSSEDEVGDAEAREWEAAAEKEQPGRDKEDVISQMRAHAKALAWTIDVAWLIREAGKSGRSAGTLISFTGGTEERLMLGSG